MCNNDIIEVDCGFYGRHSLVIDFSFNVSLLWTYSSLEAQVKTMVSLEAQTVTFAQFSAYKTAYKMCFHLSESFLFVQFLFMPTLVTTNFQILDTFYSTCIICQAKTLKVAKALTLHFLYHCLDIME